MDRLRRRHEAANNLALFSGSTQGVAATRALGGFPDEFASITASGGA